MPLGASLDTGIKTRAQNEWASPDCKQGRGPMDAHGMLKVLAADGLSMRPFTPFGDRDSPFPLPGPLSALPATGLQSGLARLQGGQCQMK